MDNFLNIPFNAKNLDRFFIRTSILNTIKENSYLFKGKLLDLGCGQMPYKELIKSECEITEYLGIDIDNALIYDENLKPDYIWDGEQLPFSKNVFDTIIMTEVLEHVPCSICTLKEAYRVLNKEGILFFTVPFLWPLHEVPHDEYRYTPFSLERIFKQSGFTSIQIFATGGWHASLAQMLGLWVRRSNISEIKRKSLSVILKPIIKYLIKRDKKPTYFYEGQMITGLYGFARKSDFS
jgi:SAM-dependent methyltransferase